MDPKDTPLQPTEQSTEVPSQSPTPQTSSAYPTPPPIEPDVRQPRKKWPWVLLIVVVSIFAVGVIAAASIVQISRDAIDKEVESAKGRNAERMDDIKALHTAAEVFYSQHGYYPSLAQFNDETLRAKEFKGYEADAYKDPRGTSFQLAAKPAEDVYAYEVTDKDGKPRCDNVTAMCLKYTLTATAENTINGSRTYSKGNLN